MEIIQSIHNPRVKKWAGLLTKKGREAEGAYLIEGLRLVEEAVKSGADVQAVIIQEGLEEKEHLEPLLAEQQIPVYQVTANVMKKLTDTQSPQGICAVTGTSRNSLDGLLEGEPLFLVLDAVQDPGNLGTMIRTADAAGFSAVILGKGTVDLYNPKVIRSTMGSVFHIPVIADVDLESVLGQLDQQGFRILSASLEGAVSYEEAGYSGPVAIIIGNEANGISPDLLERSTSRVKIPIRGRAESLNAAVAAGILMYEAVRQRS